ncbi:PREDICTED: uncharacterized protein LOC101308683 [Fragaria vesca subsp. vesca]
MNHLTKWFMKDQEEAVTRNQRRSMMMSVAALQIQDLEDKDSQQGGSSEGRSYTVKNREIMDQRLKALYFTDPCSLPGSLNDINVLGQSPLFNDVSRGETPQVRYEVQNRHYGQCYYLVYGIYPKWAAFVQAIKNPRTSQTKHFTRMQEAYIKDVERAFGILQARWAIIRGPAHGWSKENLQFIMITCIILHNMIVEDEHDEDAAEPFDPNDIPTIPKKTHIYDRIPDQDTSVHRNPNKLNQFMRRYREVRCPVMNKNLQDDLVDHLWSMKLQADENDQ